MRSESKKLAPSSFAPLKLACRKIDCHHPRFISSHFVASQHGIATAETRNCTEAPSQKCMKITKEGFGLYSPNKQTNWYRFEILLYESSSTIILSSKVLTAGDFHAIWSPALCHSHKRILISVKTSQTKPLHSFLASRSRKFIRNSLLSCQWT